MRPTFAFIAAMMFGCGTQSLPEQYCNRLDSCNRLSGSTEECVEDADKALDSLSRNQRDEVEYEFKQCLDRPSCDGFVACVQALTG